MESPWAKLLNATCERGVGNAVVKESWTITQVLQWISARVSPVQLDCALSMVILLVSLVCLFFKKIYFFRLKNCHMTRHTFFHIVFLCHNLIFLLLGCLNQDRISSICWWNIDVALLRSMMHSKNSKECSAAGARSVSFEISSQEDPVRLGENNSFWMWKYIMEEK